MLEEMKTLAESIHLTFERMPVAGSRVFISSKLCEILCCIMDRVDSVHAVQRIVIRRLADPLTSLDQNVQGSGENFKPFGEGGVEGAAADIQNLHRQLQDTRRERDKLKGQMSELEGQVAQLR